MGTKKPPGPKEAKPPAKPKPAAKARPAGQTQPTLADLKRQVFALAKVSSTKELKRTNMDLRPLDFRLKVSWCSALEVLQKAAAAYPDWSTNPPEEFKELFADIDQAAAAFSTTIDEGLKLSSQLRQAADDLESLSGELLEEAEELKTIAQASRRQSRARQLN